MSERRPTVAPRRPSAWLPILLLLVSLYVFWGLPYQLGERPMEVRFEATKEEPRP